MSANEWSRPAATRTARRSHPPNPQPLWDGQAARVAVGVDDAEPAADAIAAAEDGARRVDAKRVVLAGGDGDDARARLDAARACRPRLRAVDGTAEAGASRIAPRIQLARLRRRVGRGPTAPAAVEELERRVALVVARLVHAHARAHEDGRRREFAAEEGAVQRRVARLDVLERGARAGLE